VLPFENLSADPDGAFFSDGITQDITTELSRFYGFYVIAHRTSQQYRDKAMSAYEIGKELEVNYIVDGSVRQTGDRVRITAELIEVEDETHLWADRFDRDMGDMLAIQDEVAREIAQTIPGHIEEDRIERVRHRPRQTLTDYEHVLMGEIEREKDSCSAEARRHFETALRLDPFNARAFANMALWTAYQVYYPNTCFDDVHARVSGLAEKALELEPNDPINLAVLSSAYLTVGEHNESRRYVEKALRINANHYTVMGYAARCLAWLGETDRAMQLLALYNLHDPFSGRASVELSFEILTLAQQYEDAIAVTSRLGDDLDDIASELAAVCALAGRSDEAADLKSLFDANAPQGQPFEERMQAVLRLCANEPERELWRGGYRAAGFSF
ncbi:MAG: tetratricopeptide repeat protein, partial [Pseudomonadota bacterium]